MITELDLALSTTVERCIKPGHTLVAEYSSVKADADHALIGVLTELGELGDTIKKFTKYGQVLDRQNIVEELGDIEFYLEALRQTLCVSRSETLEHVVEKLDRRYPDGYSDQSAKDRLDKQSE